MDINDQDTNTVVYGDKFTWNSQAMMPDVIATRAKVIIISKYMTISNNDKTTLLYLTNSILKGTKLTNKHKYGQIFT